MKISGKVYMHIKFTFFWLNYHWPPQQPQSEARTSGRGEWQPPCQCWSLPLRSWPWERPVCYEAVYWPLSQLRSTWNTLEAYNWWAGRPQSLQPVIHQVGLQPVLGVHNSRDILRVRTLVTFVLAVRLLIPMKKISYQRKNYVVWIGWFSSGAQSF